jgi:selenocysteine-specific elongation factor
VIVATAGHVDHGKTTLVRALTGVDTDTLAEEKRRGMSIDLGFAYLPVADEPLAPPPIGFVDVPGHQGFIRNTLAGLMAVDQALLVVAADDGPMPQTLEHLAVLALLQVPIAAVALTKIDRVPAERGHEVSARIASLLQSLDVAPAPVFPVAAGVGIGVGPLKDHLLALAGAAPERGVPGNFRLPVDRAFSVAGAGLVVAGTVASGQVAAGDAVRLLDSGQAGRVRGLHVHQRSAAACRAGLRSALNLAGALPAPRDIPRGSWVVTGDPPQPQRRIDAELRVLPGDAALKHWTAVHVHLAASDVTGRVALLEGAQVEAGGRALVQLVLDQPLAAVHGDRFIVRDASARRTLAGGRVLDMFPPVRGRSRPERLEQLRLHAMDDAAASLRALLEAAPAGMLLEPLRRNRNLTPDEFGSLLAGWEGPRLATTAGPRAFAPRHWSGLRNAALQAVRAWHEREPAHAGPPPDRVLQGVRHGLPRDAVLAVAAELVREGALVRRGMGVALPSHAPRLDGADQELWEKVAPLLAEAGLRPPSVAELSYALRTDARRIEAMLARAAQCGHAIRVSARHYYLPAAVLALAQAAQELAGRDPAGRLTAAAYRDHSGLGRNLAIEVLEFFDHVRYTRRIGGHHVVVASAREVFPAARAQ